ncbi:MAG: helix-turn-helix domain-containing protein [Bacteroidota bacterium]|nr:helix-turn-helix domain-containing protein [Bacteroidota bacterium]
MSSNIKIILKCEFCKNEFLAKTTRTRYCSHICNSRHYKVKEREQKNKTIKKSAEQQKYEASVFAKEFLNIDETAQLIGTSRRTVQRLISKGELKASKIGSRTIIQRQEINNLFK